MYEKELRDGLGAGEKQEEGSIKRCATHQLVKGQPFYHYCYAKSILKITAKIITLK